MESSRGQNGIQLLLAVEQEAQQTVNNARNGRCRYMRQLTKLAEILVGVGLTGQEVKFSVLYGSEIATLDMLLTIYICISANNPCGCPNCRDAITTWVKMNMSLGIYSINTMDEAQRVLAAESKLVLGFFDSLEGSESEELAAASKLQSDINFYQTASAEVAEVFHIEQQIKRPALILLQTFSRNYSLFAALCLCRNDLKLGGTKLPLEFGTTVDGPTIVGRKQYFSYDYNMMNDELTLSNIKSFGENFLGDDKRLSQWELDLARQAIEPVPVGVGFRLERRFFNVHRSSYRQMTGTGRAPSPHQQQSGPTPPLPPPPPPPPPPFLPSPSPSSSSLPLEWAAAPPPPTEKSGMNGGQKAGITMGIMAGAAVVGLGGMVYKKRRSNIRRAIFGQAAKRSIL
ncbi:hypothetical protein Q3G72_002915 [Acer saccharum]|nr:hypothetical protein Q3G72_002915 [Acer saccharum]